MIYINKVYYKIMDGRCKVIITKEEMIGYSNQDSSSSKTKYLQYSYWTTEQSKKM